MMQRKKQSILITNFDGYNVHNPESTNEFKEFPTLEKAKKFAKLVKNKGWIKAKERLEAF